MDVLQLVFVFVNAPLFATFLLNALEAHQAALLMTSIRFGHSFRTGGHGDAYGQVNARYGNDPGVTFYTHVSDQRAPLSISVK